MIESQTVDVLNSVLGTLCFYLSANIPPVYCLTVVIPTCNTRAVEFLVHINSARF